MSMVCLISLTISEVFSMLSNGTASTFAQRSQKGWWISWREGLTNTIQVEHIEVIRYIFNEFLFKYIGIWYNIYMHNTRYKTYMYFRLMFEMLTHWPERNTFKSMKPIDFPLYKQMIKDPIALDPIMDKIDINSLEQVTLFLYVHCLTL